MSSKDSVLPSEEFAAFCEAELERRLNSGLEFDQIAFQEAMDMALKKLERIEHEGLT